MNNLSLKEGLKKISDIEDKEISISKIADSLGDNAAKILIIIFCSPTALPTPALPVITQILSLVVIITLFQLIIRRKKIWLPKKIGNKKIANKTVVSSCKTILKYHSKIEAFIKQRVKIISLPPFDMTIYLYCIFLSLVVALPLPFSNTVPSIAIIIIMLGLLERDGLLTIAGIIIGLIGVTGLFIVYHEGFNLLTG